MPIGGVETTQHPKEAILRTDDLLKEKLNMLEKKLLQIRNELLGASSLAGEDKAEKSQQAGFLGRIQDHLYENCVKVDRMNAIADEMVRSLVSQKVTPGS